MGQKSNPTLLRLEKTNQHFKACWYSHHYYSDQLHNNFKIHDYITKIFNRINRCRPLIYIKNNHQSNQIMCFFPKKRIRRFKRFKYKKVTTLVKKATPKWSLLYGAALEKKIKVGENRCYLSTLLLSTFHKQSSLLLRKKNKSGPKPQVSNVFLGGAPLAALSVTPGDGDGSHNHLAKSQTIKEVKSSPLQICKILTPNILSVKGKHKTRIENTINNSNFCLPSTRWKAHVKGKFPLITDDLEYSQISHLLSTFPDNSLNRWLHLAQFSNPGMGESSCHTLPSPGVTAKVTSQSPVSDVSPAFTPKMRAELSQVINFYAQQESQICRKKTKLYPIKVSKVTQNSDFLAQKIATALKKRVTYNRLRRQILRDVAKSQYVKGIRVTLSGRVASKSKKAQKARTNTFHWGQTELHVFSSLVQFTYNHLITPWGKIGIKVWICYHS